MTLNPPFPWFGGKSVIASDVWDALGNPDNYVEPFAGSIAVLLCRPHQHRWWQQTETVNDLDGFVSNFWRAVQSDPDTVAKYANWPVNENDLHARHAWLIGQRTSLSTRLEGDPGWYDPKIAGWWVWGICAWIGSGWCSGAGPWRVVDGELVNRKRPHLGNDGRGINRQLPHLGNDGQGINRKLPHLGDDGRGFCDLWSEHLIETMRQLADRLRRVRVCCGDWSRVCGPTPTVKLGTTGVFLDPPYTLAERTDGLYAVDGDVAADVRRWAIERGGDPRYRIVLCGYEGEHEMPDGWWSKRWKARGGYGSHGEGRGRSNANREILWFSPHCLRPNRARQMALMPMEMPA